MLEVSLSRFIERSAVIESCKYVYCGRNFSYYMSLGAMSVKS
jgi:hypothetical protein